MANARAYVKGLNAYLKEVGKQIYDNVAVEQTNRLIAYAEDKVQDIGNKVRAYHGTHHMDRTGNLLDSICWGVVYNGKLVGSGFYREQRAGEESHLHEWFSGDISSLFPVYGHGLAEQFIGRFAQRNSGGKGWRVFFAILAPYWGYWEEGFEMRIKGVSKGFHQWVVMSEVYDQVKADLKPAKVTFRNYVPTYNTNKRNNLKSMVRNFSNNPAKERRHFKNIPRIKSPWKRRRTRH